MGNGARGWRFGFALLVVGLVALAAGPAVADTEWTHTYGDPGPGNFSSANAVAVADDGAVYVAGPFFGTFNGQTAVDDFDVFLMKLTQAGAVVWVKAWDPDSVDGHDYSANIPEPSESWDLGMSKGQAWVDGAGNVGLALGGFIAVVEPDGSEVGSLDGSGFKFVDGQPDPDGGVLGLDSQGLTAFTADLAVEWGPVALPGYDGSTPDGTTSSFVALDDGGAVFAFDKSPEFTFQHFSQILHRVGSDGGIDWSVTHNSRCSGLEGRKLLPVLAMDGEVVIPSKVADSQCVGVAHQASLARYSLATGALLGNYPVVPADHQSSNAYRPLHCGVEQTDPPYTTVPVVIDEWQAEPCGQPDLLEVFLEDPFPTIAGTESTAFDLATLSINIGEFPPSLVKWKNVSGSMELEWSRRLTDGDGIKVMDIAVLPDGSAVVVGRSDGGAAVPSATPGTHSSLPATAQPVALVVVTPSEYTAPPPPPPPPADSFIDDDGSVFESDIEWMAAAGITKGCNPTEGNTRFCPDAVVTRGQMAAFLVRALDLTASLDDPFIDDDESIFEADIERLAAAGITKGCNPGQGNTKFCPDATVTREQMAAFLVRAFGYTDDGGGDLFTDDDGIFEADIDRLGTAGVTSGCNPPTNDRYCPKGTLTRGQMAAFLHRALG